MVYGLGSRDVRCGPACGGVCRTKTVQGWPTLWANFKALIGISSQSVGPSLAIWAKPVQFSSGGVLAVLWAAERLRATSLSRKKAPDRIIISFVMSRTARSRLGGSSQRAAILAVPTGPPQPRQRPLRFQKAAPELQTSSRMARCTLGRRMPPSGAIVCTDMRIGTIWCTST